MEVSSLVLLLACIAQWSPTPWFQYAMSVASISLGVCLILQTMEFLTPGFLKKPVIGEHASEKLCSVFLLLWWIFGTGFITFKGRLVYCLIIICEASYISSSLFISIYMKVPLPSLKMDGSVRGEGSSRRRIGVLDLTSSLTILNHEK